MTETSPLNWLMLCGGVSAFIRDSWSGMPTGRYQRIIVYMYCIAYIHRCHMTEKVKEHVVKHTKSHTCLIPGGLTSQLQPADVSWKKPFKAAYCDLYNEWMASGSKSFTPAGNMSDPDKLLCLTWVKKAWASVSAEVIIKSFKTCGISVNTDGSEDAQVHCLKPEGVAAEHSQQ